jgi:hypothetical protein
VRVLDASVVIDAMAVPGPGRRPSPAARGEESWLLVPSVTGAALVTADDRLRRADGPRCTVLGPEEALAGG